MALLGILGVIVVTMGFQLLDDPRVVPNGGPLSVRKAHHSGKPPERPR